MFEDNIIDSACYRGALIAYQTDLLLNVAVIVAIILDTMLRIKGADAAFGIIIAAYLLWGGWKAASMAMDQLLDREWPEDKKARFLEVANRHPQLKDIHDFRTRSSGMHDFCQFHVWVDPNMTLKAAHDVMDEVEAELMREFPGVEVLIHPEPEGHADDTSFLVQGQGDHHDGHHEEKKKAS